jgi:HAD superfamily hydrolase (TIGR01509 family)
MSSVKNILFDLGGVLLNIDYNLTIQAFRDLNIPNFEEIYSQSQQSGLFDEFETGKIDEEVFVKELISFSRVDLPHSVVKDAWNAMLLNFPKERLDLLSTLKENYGVYLLSNTNAIHYRAFNEIFHESHDGNFSNYFHKTYYSHLLGKRKPNKDVFEEILHENKLRPDELLFIDDSEQHVVGAAELGINAQWMNPDKDVFDVLRQSGVLT